MHGQPWPVGAFFLTFGQADGERIINYQGRVLAVDGDRVWGELYSWLDGSANGIKALPVDDDIVFYATDREMRAASFEFHRYRLEYVGTFEENEAVFTGEAPTPVPWTTPLPAGFDREPVDA